MDQCVARPSRQSCAFAQFFASRLNPAANLDGEGDRARAADEGAIPSNHGSIPRERQRAFESARRAAMSLCRGQDKGRYHLIGAEEEDPAVIERVRWLVVAMGVARGTPGGRAIAEIARLGYVVTRTPILPATGWRPGALRSPGRRL